MAKVINLGSNRHVGTGMKQKPHKNQLANVVRQAAIGKSATDTTKKQHRTNVQKKPDPAACTVIIEKHPGHLSCP